MSFSPALFLSNIRTKDGLAKPSRFEIILPIPKYVGEFVSNGVLDKLLNLPNLIVSSIQEVMQGQVDAQSKTSNPTLTRFLALQCESAELPGKTLLTQDAKVYGPTFKVPYQTQYNDITLTFLCTNDFYERKLFERWIECIHPSDTNNLRYPKDEKTRYMTNIKIIQYDEFIKQIYAVELIDAYPIGVSSQALAWSEDGFHRLGVQFTYQRYRVLYDGEYDLVAAAGALFGTKIAPWFNKTGQRVSDVVNGGIGRALF